MPLGMYSWRALGNPSSARCRVFAANSGSRSAIAMDAAIIPPLHTWFQLLLPWAHHGSLPSAGQLGLIPFSMRAFSACSMVAFGRSPGVQSRARANAKAIRSEEHTSELQSREKLVCRLLLA